MRKFITNLQELFFPEECLHCGAKTKAQNNIPLCFNCELQLESGWKRGFNNELLINRFKGIIDLEHTIIQYYFSLDGVSQSIIHEAKYKKQTYILKHYGFVMGSKIESNNLLFNYPDLIVPVPNNWIKKLTLGYNQAEIYSNEIAIRIGIDHSTKILKKRHDGKSQTKRNKLQRLKHLTYLYYITNKDKIVNKHILLVDDVITSGATVETCANLLLQAGAKKVSVLAFMLVK